MSSRYNPPRTRNLYKPGSNKPVKLSRSRIDRFVECRRCFYLDRRLGAAIRRPFAAHPWTFEVAIFAFALLVYQASRALVIGDPSTAFEKRLVAAGFAARSETVRSRQRKGERHTIFLGRI